MATYVVTGDQYRVVDRRMCEIKRMLNQKDGSPLDPEAIGVALQDIVEGHFKVDDKFSARFAAAIAACDFDWVDGHMNPSNFPESVFGQVGEGYILARLSPITDLRLSEDKINAWFAGTVKESGHEAATLADGFDFITKNPEAHCDGLVVFWASVAAGGRVACLGSSRRSGRSLNVLRQDDIWESDCRFLLRPIPYATRFAAAIEVCGFSWWDQERITPENFPGESFDGGDYDLECRRLPPKSEGYDADEINEVALAWKKEDATILGSASAGDGLFLAKESRAGRRDQPKGWIVCPGSTSVDGGLFYLRRHFADREAHVSSRDDGWGGDAFVLLRKVRQP